MSDDEKLRHFTHYMYASQLFNAASGALIFLSILGGAGPSAPLNSIYYLEADTDGIEGAVERTRWNFLRICSVDRDGNNADCQPTRLVPLVAWDSGARELPRGLQGPLDGGRIRADIYGTWIAAWIITWIWLVFTIIKLVDAMNSNKFSAMHIDAGRWVRYLPVFLSVPAVALTLYTFISMQQAFTGDGREANLGVSAIGYLIGAFLAIAICEVLLSRIRSMFEPVYSTLGQ